MGDLREYSFGDWFRLFLKAIPAYLLAAAVVAVPVAAVAALIRFLMPYRGDTPDHPSGGQVGGGGGDGNRRALVTSQRASGPRAPPLAPRYHVAPARPVAVGIRPGNRASVAEKVAIMAVTDRWACVPLPFRCAALWWGD
jgi:hypothetical protein